VQTPDTAVGEQLLDALARRDYEAVGACFADDAALRAVVPPGVREADGTDAIVERFRIWTATLDGYELAESDAAMFGDLLRLRWVVRGNDPSEPERGPSTFEQTAYAEVRDGRITRMRLACSGHRPLG
jgi:ketosteroid isomerase-like protein